MRRILQSPADAVQIASEAVQWVDNYGGVVLNQPGPFGQMHHEQQQEQPIDDEDDAPSVRLPRRRPTRPVTGARRSTSSIPDRLPSPVTPPFRPAYQPEPQPEPQPDPQPEPYLPDPYSIPMCSYPSGDIMGNVSSVPFTTLMSSDAVGSAVFGFSSFTTPPNFMPHEPLYTPPAPQRRRPGPSQTGSHMEEGITQLHSTYAHTIPPPNFSDTPQPHQADTPQPHQATPEEHVRRPRTAFQRVTRLLSRRDKGKDTEHN